MGKKRREEKARGIEINLFIKCECVAHRYLLDSTSIERAVLLCTILNTLLLWKQKRGQNKDALYHRAENNNYGKK